MTTPKHRRSTRTDRLLLWAKDRLTLRRRPQPVLETNNFEAALAEQEAEWNRRADRTLSIFDWALDEDEAVAELLEEMESIPVFIRAWEKKL